MEYISNYAFCSCTINYIRFPKRLKDFYIDAFQFSDIGALDFRDTQFSNFDINWLGSIRSFSALLLPRGLTKIESKYGSYINDYLKTINSLVLSIDGNTIKNSFEDYGISQLFEKVTMLAIRNIEKIDFRVLENFPNLKEVFLTKHIKEIGEDAFSRYPTGQLEEVYLNDNIEMIGDDAFRDNPKLSNIRLPKNLKSIGNGAFHGCKGLNHIDIPTSVTYIGSTAFWGTGLKDVKGLNSNIKYGMYGSESDKTPFMGTPFDEKFEKIQTTFSYMALGKIAKEIPQWQKRKNMKPLNNGNNELLLKIRRFYR